MREYEMMLITDPDLDENKRKEIFLKIEEMIKNGGGEIIKIEDWGLREFAYPIRKKNMGYYTVWEFRSNPEIPLSLKSNFRLMKEIFRVMILRRENVKSYKKKKEE